MNRDQIDTPLPNRISFFAPPIARTPRDDLLFFSKQTFNFFRGIGSPHQKIHVSIHKKTFKGVATNPHIHIIHTRHLSLLCFDEKFLVVTAPQESNHPLFAKLVVSSQFNSSLNTNNISHHKTKNRHPHYKTHES